MTFAVRTDMAASGADWCSIQHYADWCSIRHAYQTSVKSCYTFIRVYRNAVNASAPMRQRSRGRRAELAKSNAATLY